MSGDQFKPAWWLPSSHMQTIWPSIFRFSIKGLPLTRERFELPDHDFLDVDWVNKEGTGPIVLILHGFEGSIESHYAKGMLQAAYKQGWRGAFMHFRGCSGEPNRLPRGYHSGDTHDVSFIVNRLLDREPDVSLAAIGYSLGGNVLLKWLGETGRQNPLKAAVAISVPFDLHSASKRIQRGFSRFYQWYLLKCARARLLEKLLAMDAPINLTSLAEAQTIREFDHHYTVPMHGFANVDEYYTITSCGRYLRAIKVPTLILHAKDDPFMSEDVIPNEDEVSPCVQLEITQKGGHVGFVTGKFPWKPRYWLEERVPAFLYPHL
jgi:predicted alpha/beta-fold hydrolase